MRENSLESPHHRTRVTAMASSLAISLVLMAVKFLAYRLTGSAAILSDALESIINVVASSFALWSVILSAAPPDENHPYGHGKVEYFSAGFEGALIILAAFGIIWEAWDKIFNPSQLPNLDNGIWLLAGASLVNLALGVWLVRAGKRTDSLILTADGQHILTDVFTSGGVILGLILVLLTGWHRLDGMIACLVALNIVFTGSRLVRESVSKLMHEADPALISAICEVLTEHRKDAWIGVHRLRSWRSGTRVHIDFHLILPREISLEQSHREVKAIEGFLKDRFGPASDILIHVDPCCEPDECPACNNDPCDFRMADGRYQNLWNVATASGNRRETS